MLQQQGSLMVEQRHFTGWDEPALPSAVNLLVERHATAGELALRAVVLVVPGARAGRRLKELLVEAATARRLRLMPPRVVTVGELPELLYQPVAPTADDALCRRAWARALRRLDPARLGLIFAERPADGDLRQWLQLGRQLQQLHAQVAAAALTFRDVASRRDASLLFDDTARWSVLADLQDDCSADLRRVRREDRDLARIAALRRGAVVCPAEVWLVGVAEMPRIVRDMLTLLPTSRVHAVVHAPPQLAGAFDALGAVVPSWWAAAAVPLRDDQLRVVDGPAAQAAAAVAAIAALDGSRAADDVVIGVPDGEVVPWLEERLAEAGVPSRHAAGTPLPSTAPFRLLAAVADVLDGGTAEAWAALARHPDLWRWLREHAAGFDHRGAPVLREADAWLQPLDRYLDRHLPARLAEPLPGTGSSGGRAGVDALIRLLRGPGFLGALRGRRTVAEWMPVVLDLLLAAYGRTPLRREVPAERRLLAACTQLRDAAAALHRLAGLLDDACDAPTAIRVLLDDARGGSVPNEPDAAAVELLGWLELHLDDAPVAIVTGANEPYLPESINADVFLPDSLRAALGMLDNERRTARDAYQLTALLHSRRSATVIAGRRSATGDPLRPSRLLLATSGERLARRILDFYGAAGGSAAAGAHDATHAAASAATHAAASDALHATASSVMRGASAATHVASAATHATSGFALPPHPVLRASRPIEQVAVTSFRMLLQDPYMFALERVLQLRAEDDAAREMDPLAFGSIAHEILQRFGSGPDATTSDAARIAARLDALLDEQARQRFGRPARAAVSLQLEQLRMRLHAFARWHADWVADGWRVVAVECGTPPEGVPFDVDGTPIRLTGRIDRIDHHPATGRWAVFDYKTSEKADPPGKAHRSGRGEAAVWIDLQLPMYRHILPHVLDAAGAVVFAGDIADVSLGYISICAESDQVGALMADWSADELAAADDVACECVRMLRHNVFEYDGSTGAWLDDDLAALLGHGRITAGDEEES
jgi:ATP-dependent helicase/nuclease subunit B